LCGGERIDVLAGGPGDDRVFGGPDSRLSEGDGAYYVGDTLRGGEGADLLAGGGGRGEDTLSYAESRRGVDVDLTAGRATGQGRDVLAGIEQVVGSPYADRMAGRFDDLLPELREHLHFWGKAGPDVFRGSAAVEGGDGQDIFLAWDGMYAFGGGGADELTFVPPEQQPPAGGKLSAYFNGGPGADSVDMTGMQEGYAAPGPGDDAVTGSPGNDYVWLSAGDDTVNTGGGADTVEAGFGADTVRTGPGDDQAYTFCGTTYLRAGPGRDVVFSRGFHTIYCAEPGDDVLFGASGHDSLDYRPLYLDRTVAGVIVDLEADTATGAGGVDTVAGFEDVIGSGGRDRVFGDSLNNLLAGAGGGDQLVGRGGDDTIRGSRGNDTAEGGDGNDSCDAETEIDCES
jgi:Ca2+-binding RTX toxin-like protein